MPPLAEKILRQIFFAIVALLGVALPGVAIAAEKSDVLLDVVSHCLVPHESSYCSRCLAPRSDSVCGAKMECKNTTDVWALSDRYTAIRDAKMCGCAAEFVHGLVLPRNPVTGVEDPRRPDGIWQFAWDVAVGRIEPESIALVVNPRLHRSQNQLHVHLVRLVAEARKQFSAHANKRVASLDQVWNSAAQLAASTGLDDYGVLVVQNQPSEYLVVVTRESPEKQFTKARCN